LAAQSSTAALTFGAKRKLGQEPVKPRVETFLPPLPSEHRTKYTLVLDLDETLVHSSSDLANPNTSTIQVRPGAPEFIDEMADYYELVIFTAGTKDYADWALPFVDPKGRISHRLYREHAVQKGPVFVKDVSKLGRDLRKVIIIDNIVENFQLQPENGIFINTWEGDINDTTLYKLAPVLKQIVVQKILDVRIALRHYRDYQMRCMLSQQKPKLDSYS
jgi:CTD small phosphatase-like protein 2